MGKTITIPSGIGAPPQAREGAGICRRRPAAAGGAEGMRGGGGLLGFPAAERRGGGPGLWAAPIAD